MKIEGSVQNEHNWWTTLGYVERWERKREEPVAKMPRASQKNKRLV